MNTQARHQKRSRHLFGERNLTPTTTTISTSAGTLYWIVVADFPLALFLVEHGTTSPRMTALFLRAFESMAEIVAGANISTTSDLPIPRHSLSIVRDRLRQFSQCPLLPSLMYAVRGEANASLPQAGTELPPRQAQGPIRGQADERGWVLGWRSLPDSPQRSACAGAAG